MGGPTVIPDDAYPDKSQFWDDLVAAYREEVAQLYAAGCRYLQMDDVGFAYLCDAGVPGADDRSWRRPRRARRRAIATR